MPSLLLAAMGWKVHREVKNSTPPNMNMITSHSSLY